MKLKNRTFIVLFLCIVVSLQLFASNKGLTQAEQEAILQQLAFLEKRARETSLQPLVIENVQALTVTAYTNTRLNKPWIDEKVVYIPEGWKYHSHCYWHISQYGNYNVTPAWTVTDPTDPSKVAEVHIKVTASSPLEGFSWIGAELTVMIVPL